MSEDHNEEEIWLLAVGGDQAARARIAELAERYSRTALQRHGVRQPDLDDLAQEVVLGVDRCRASGRGVRVFEKFVYFRSLSILKTYRARQRLRQHMDLDACDPVAKGPDPGVAVEAQELTRAIADCRDALPEALHAVVTLRHTFDCKLPEIAERLGLSLGGVRERLQRAWERIRACMRHRGHYLEDGPS